MKLLNFDYAPFVVNSGLTEKKRFWRCKKAIKYCWEAANKEAITEKDDLAYTHYNIDIRLFGFRIGMIFLSKKNEQGYIVQFRKFGGLSARQVRENLIKSNNTKN